MKVSELIEELKKLDQDAAVILSADGEGNGFGYLTTVEVSRYTTEYGLDTLHPDDYEERLREQAEYGEEDDTLVGVVLWP